MKFEPTLCPKCKGKPRGTCELVPGLALLMELEPGDYDYEGYTKLNWDAQTTIEDADGLVTLVCVECDGEWQAKMINSPEAAKVEG